MQAKHFPLVVGGPGPNNLGKKGLTLSVLQKPQILQSSAIL